MSSIEFNSLLVPIDFSEPSRDAIEWAMRLVNGDDPSIILVHVIDEELVRTVVESGFGSRDEITDRLRKQAEAQLEGFPATPTEGVEVARLISVGTPFLEIIRKATDFAVDAIVMDRAGAGRQVGHLLFGSTAEHVLRGSTRPVIVLPNKSEG